MICSLSKMAEVSSCVVKCSRILLLFAAFLVLLKPGYPLKRKVTLKELHCPHRVPECKDKNITVIYVAAESVNHDNIVHFIWSAYGGPTVITAYSSNLQKNHAGPNLTIDWDKLFQSTAEDTPPISFIPEVHYISAFTLSSVVQFDDPNDDLYFTKSPHVILHDLHEVQWRTTEVDEKEFHATFTGDFLGGTLSFKCWAANHDDRNTGPPRQRYSSNITRFTIDLKGLHTNFNESDRLAIEVASTAKSSGTESTCVMEDESIDDEYSPAVFRTVVINSTDTKTTSFISWKPVMYIDRDRELKYQVPSYQYLYYSDKYHQQKISLKCSPMTPRSTKLPQVVFGVMPKSGVTTYPVRLSSGQKKDGWYKKTGFMSWSGQAGYGRPLFDEISQTLLITIITGLGVPVLLILAGSLYVCVKKYRERKTASSYGRIN